MRKWPTMVGPSRAARISRCVRAMYGRLCQQVIPVLFGVRSVHPAANDFLSHAEGHLRHSARRGISQCCRASGLCLLPGWSVQCHEQAGFRPGMRQAKGPNSRMGGIRPLARIRAFGAGPRGGYPQASPDAVLGGIGSGGSDHAVTGRSLQYGINIKYQQV